MRHTLPDNTDKTHFVSLVGHQSGHIKKVVRKKMPANAQITTPQNPQKDSIEGFEGWPFTHSFEFTQQLAAQLCNKRCQ
jgi:hypothetical protein